MIKPLTEPNQLDELQQDDIDDESENDDHINEVLPQPSSTQALEGSESASLKHNSTEIVLSSAFLHANQLADICLQMFREVSEPKKIKSNNYIQ